MIKEILESNGIKIKSKVKLYESGKIIVSMYDIYDEVKGYILYTDFNEENVYRKYIKENGFKLSLFNKAINELVSKKTKMMQCQYTYQIPKCGIGLEVEIVREYADGNIYITFWVVDNKIEGIDTKYCNSDKQMEKVSKLIAYLYSQDIKIVDDINE